MREMLARKFKMADERNEEAVSDIIKGKTYSQLCPPLFQN
jgi:hypothetical protein